MRRRLEQVAAQLPPRTGLTPEWSDWEWWAIFQDFRDREAIQREPDFLPALRFYRNAIREAQHLVPDLCPPTDFDPLHPRRVPRLETWRLDDRCPRVAEGFHWLLAMVERILDRRPSVTQKEFQELAGWYQEHRMELIARSDEMLLIRNQKPVTVETLERGLKLGPRVREAGWVVACLRQLRRVWFNSRI